MEVVFFLPSFESGGAEKVMMNVAKGIQNRGHGVQVLVLNNEGNLNPKEKMSTTELKTVGFSGIKIPLYIYQINEYITENEPDIFISSMTHINVMCSVLFMIFNYNTKLILTEHNTLSEKRGLQSRLVKYFAKIFYPAADSIVGVSQGVSNDLNRILKDMGNDIKTIHNPVLTEDIIEESQKSIDHRWLNDDGVPVFLGAGRMVEQKDFPNLIKAFKLVNEEIDSKLIIIGRGNHELELENVVIEQGVQDDVDFPGFVDNPYAYMRQASVFVLSSAWEGLPTVLIEAMACGCPIVSTDCPSGPSEILDSGKYGRMVPVGDPQGLSDAMIKELNDPTPSDTLQKSAFERFSKDKVLDEYEDLIMNIYDSN